MLPASIHEAALHPELSAEKTKAALKPILLARFPRMDFDFRFCFRCLNRDSGWVSKSRLSKNKGMKADFYNWRNQILQNSQDISPLKFGMAQDEVVENFGKPDAVSTMKSGGKPLLLKYHDIELHFDRKVPHGLNLIYSDDAIELSITADHEERNNQNENI